MCIKHVSIIIKVAWNIRNYRYVWDVSGHYILFFVYLLSVLSNAWQKFRNAKYVCLQSSYTNVSHFIYPPIPPTHQKTMLISILRLKGYWALLITILRLNDHLPLLINILRQKISFTSFRSTLQFPQPNKKGTIPFFPFIQTERGDWTIPFL
jgi:hypothetical protein